MIVQVFKVWVNQVSGAPSAAWGCETPAGPVSCTLNLTLLGGTVPMAWSLVGSVPSYCSRRISDLGCQVEGLQSCPVNAVVFVSSKPFIKGKGSTPRQTRSQNIMELKGQSAWSAWCLCSWRLFIKWVCDRILLEPRSQVRREWLSLTCLELLHCCHYLTRLTPGLCGAKLAWSTDSSPILHSDPTSKPSFRPWVLQSFLLRGAMTSPPNSSQFWFTRQVSA